MASDFCKGFLIYHKDTNGFTGHQPEAQKGEPGQPGANFLHPTGSRNQIIHAALFHTHLSNAIMKVEL